MWEMILSHSHWLIRNIFKGISWYNRGIVKKSFPEGRSSRHLENSGRVHLEKQVKNQRFESGKKYLILITRFLC